MVVNIATGITVKWLGLSGVEIRASGCAILVDPIFTRIPLRRAVFGRIEPDERAVQSRLTGCSDVFVTHAHHDHMMDAPAIVRLTGASFYGSPNACAIALASGAPIENVHEFKPGCTVQAGPFAVTAFQATHVRLPGFGSKPIRGAVRLPLKIRQYRMDGSMVFLVEAQGHRLLIGPGLCLGDAGRVDGLLYSPIYNGSQNMNYLAKLKPRFLLPIHWEGLFPRDKAPLRAAFAPGFPPRRVDMGKIAAMAAELGIRYVEPVVDKEYAVSDLLSQTNL